MPEPAVVRPGSAAGRVTTMDQARAAVLKAAIAPTTTGRGGAATFIADNVSGGYPTVTGFTDTFVMATVFLTVCLGTAFLVPAVRPRPRGSIEPLPTVAKDAA